MKYLMLVTILFLGLNVQAGSLGDIAGIQKELDKKYDEHKVLNALRNESVEMVVELEKKNSELLKEVLGVIADDNDHKGVLPLVKKQLSDLELKASIVAGYDYEFLKGNLQSAVTGIQDEQVVADQFDMNSSKDDVVDYAFEVTDFYRDLVKFYIQINEMLRLPLQTLESEIVDLEVQIHEILKEASEKAKKNNKMINVTVKKKAPSIKPQDTKEFWHSKGLQVP